ncbi:sensor histidine kinase [Pseudomonas sp. gcc21]|uniref:sensor histidine kinase n=1 Tax=Pseudomonas sp. gcc21 TaxID=2726989 RepID=UPI0014524A39|nr:sensor histidine kinase [Pseudomonas sp. gcc21]QJD59308.1 sensor histidine kinase [Pseudomonas sp. gcc21]
MRSIQRSLSLGLVAVLVILSLLLLQTSLWLFEAGLRRTLAADLRDETEGLLIALIPDGEGVRLDAQRINPRYQRAFSGHYFRIDVADRTWRSRSLWDADPSWPSSGGLSDELIDGPQNQRLMAYRAEFQRDGRIIHINVAQDYTPVLDSFAQVRLGGFGLVLLFLLILVLLQRYAVKAALWPLEQARQQVAQLQQGQRQQLEVRAAVELQPLIEQINHLLSHTDNTLKRSRHALGNLGHALKTPLAVLSSLIQREELSAHPALRRNLEEQLSQIQHRVGRELTRARLAGEVLPGAHFDCAAELPPLLETLRMIHPRDISLRWTAPPACRLPWDREDMLELLGNLLDNACKWARSAVTLTIVEEADGYRMLIEDDGPGIELAERARVLERGTRLDQHVDGQGLGLGIVRDILAAWHGELSLGTSALGGLSVDIRLPRSQPLLG